MEKTKSLTKNSLFYILYNILNIVFPFITGIYAARILIPDNIGMVESARNLVQYFVILSFLGIPTYGLREVSKNRSNKEDLNKIYSELMIINFISTCFFGLSYIFVVFSIPLYRNDIILYLLTGLLIFLNIFNNSWLYEGLEEFKYISIRNFIFKIICFVLLVLFVRDKSDYLIYASITIIGTAGNYILNIFHSRKFVKLNFKNINLKRHMKSIMFLVFVNLAIEIYSLVDITMLGFLCKKSNVAYYSYGIKIHRIIIQVMNTFTTVIVPRLSIIYHNKKTDNFNQLLSKTFKIILILAMPIIVGIWFEADYFICLLYGDKYITSSYVLKILSFAILISPVGYLLGSRVMLVCGKEKKMIIPVSIGAVVNVILNLLLIPYFREMGAAFASVISEVIVMISYILLSRKYFKLVNMRKTVINVIISCLILSFYLYLINLIVNSLIFYIFAGIIFVLIYLFIMILLKEEVVIDILNKLKIKILKKC